MRDHLEAPDNFPDTAGVETIQVATVLPWAVDTPFWQHTANYSGGTPRMYLMDDPQEVVDAIVWASVHPTKELAVGWKAQGADRDSASRSTDRRLAIRADAVWHHGRGWGQGADGARGPGEAAA
jgi:hypothetical protein